MLHVEDEEYGVARRHHRPDRVLLATPGPEAQSVALVGAVVVENLEDEGESMDGNDEIGIQMQPKQCLDSDRISI